MVPHVAKNAVSCHVMSTVTVQKSRETTWFSQGLLAGGTKCSVFNPVSHISKKNIPNHYIGFILEKLSPAGIGTVVGGAAGLGCAGAAVHIHSSLPESFFTGLCLSGLLRL